MLLNEQPDAVRGEGGDQEHDQQPVGRSGELPDEPPSERRRPLGDGQHPRGTRQRHRRDLHVGRGQMVEGKGARHRAARFGALCQRHLPRPPGHPWACITHPRAPPSPIPPATRPRRAKFHIPPAVKNSMPSTPTPPQALRQQRPRYPTTVTGRQHPVCSHDGHLPVHLQHFHADRLSRLGRRVASLLMPAPLGLPSLMAPPGPEPANEGARTTRSGRLSRDVGVGSANFSSDRRPAAGAPLLSGARPPRPPPPVPWLW
jgi:hypothetical protein